MSAKIATKKKSKTLLFELGTEELPPLQLEPLASALAANLIKNLERLSITFSNYQVFATPRRLAVMISEIEPEIPEQHLTIKGPPIKVAFDSQGQPTVAATKFAASCQVMVEQLFQVEEHGHVFLAGKVSKAKRKTLDCLPEIIIASVKSLPIKKGMIWEASDQPFVRPVRWILALFGDQVIELELFGIKSTNQTFGHRFHHPGAITVESAEKYEELLVNGYVIADSNRRKQLICSQITKLFKSNEQPVVDEELLNEVNALVEWPVALVGEFEAEFLSLPKEILVTVLKKHQRCFPVNDYSGKLAAKFVVVSNLASKDQQRVIKGNERVVKARFCDAQYFYQNDLKRGLAANFERLSTLVFQTGLGSMQDKSKRLAALVSLIAPKTEVVQKLVSRAALLAKCDLVTQVVGEFTELQGIMGYYYAIASEPPAVSEALKEQYLPRFAKDQLPKSEIGVILAIADRLDHLVGLAIIDKMPTADKDPFGARRTVIGLIRIIIEEQFKLDLKKAVAAVVLAYDRKSPDISGKILAFIHERLRFFYQERGANLEIFKAVSSKNFDDLLDFSKRFAAMENFIKLPVASGLVESFKRIKNITAGEGILEYSQALLLEKAEQQLSELLENKQELLRSLFQRQDYDELLSQLVDFVEPLTDFFDTVMVMVDDLPLRANRVALLNNLKKLLGLVADWSQLTC